MRAIDTNVLVRLITGDDPTQVQAAEGFVQRGAWVPQLVLAETAWVLASIYQKKPPEIANAIEMLLNHEHLTVENTEVVSLALENFRARPAVGFSNCLVLEIARKAGHLPLGTFDRNLAKLDGAERL
jgi:predicted nucleic-acid-binding protein